MEYFNTNLAIEHQQIYFRWYYKLPLIMLIVTLVVAFVIGIVDGQRGSCWAAQ